MYSDELTTAPSEPKQRPQVEIEFEILGKAIDHLSDVWNAHYQRLAPVRNGRGEPKSNNEPADRPRPPHSALAERLHALTACVELTISAIEAADRELEI